MLDQRVRDSVTPVVSQVELCTNEDFALQKVKPLRDWALANGVNITSGWNSKNYSFTFLKYLA